MRLVNAHLKTTTFTEQGPTMHVLTQGLSIATICCCPLPIVILLLLSQNMYYTINAIINHAEKVTLLLQLFLIA